MTDEQEEALQQLRSYSYAVGYVSMSLTFLEKKLGKVHRITVDYRKGIYKDCLDKMKQAQEQADKVNLLDVLFKQFESANQL